MIITQMTTNEVKVSFESNEVRKVHTISALGNQTDLLSIDDFVRVMLRHAQETLDAFPDRIFDGDTPT